MLDYLILFVVGILWSLSDYCLEYFFKDSQEINEKTYY